MTIETAGVFGCHMLIVHHFFVAGLLGVLVLFMARGAGLLFYLAGPHEKRRLEHTVF